MYYMMHCSGPDDQDMAMLTYKRDHPLRSWSTGMKFSTDTNAAPEIREPSVPVRAEVVEDYEGAMIEFWTNPVPLMSKRLAAALREAGVANIDEYDAVIYDPSTGKTHKNYIAFNVVGVVAAANLGQSEYDAAIPMFDSVVIDEDATRQALLFRLKESTNAIVVHEKVKNSLEDAGFDTLTFVEPESWAG